VSHHDATSGENGLDIFSMGSKNKLIYPINTGFNILLSQNYASHFFLSELWLLLC